MKIRNYAQFYTLIQRMPHEGMTVEELKAHIVKEYTWGRTASLKEMTDKEYRDCIRALEKLTGKEDQRRKLRSRCLKLMQEIGVDTTSWNKINDFCKNPRIAGKLFAQLSIDELQRLQPKLRAIKDKPRPAPAMVEKREVVIMNNPFTNKPYDN